MACKRLPVRGRSAPLERGELMPAKKKKLTADNALAQAEAILQKRISDTGTGFMNRRRQHPFFNRAHPFLQAMLEEIIKESPAIIEAIAKIILATK